MNIAVIYGSVRTARQGIKAAKFMVKKLEERGHDVSLIDPMEHELPMLDKTYKEFDSGAAPPAMQKIHEMLDAADGFIVVSAEYNHSIPSALKNLLDHYMPEYFFKPSGIVTYSAGPFGGVRGAMSLRMILPELGMPTIPTMFAISKVGASFDDDGNALDDSWDRRSKKFLDEFEWYVTALANARTEGMPY